MIRHAALGMTFNAIFRPSGPPTCAATCSRNPSQYPSQYQPCEFASAYSGQFEQAHHQPLACPSSLLPPCHRMRCLLQDALGVQHERLGAETKVDRLRLQVCALEIRDR